MDEATLKALLDPAILRELAQLEYDPKTELTQASKLRKRGHTPELATQLIAQSRLRALAETKFGPFAADMLFTSDALAQATRLAVAAHHAKRLHAQPGLRISDLGCGIGGDAMAFAALGADVFALDADPVTAALAAFNLRRLDTVTVACGRAEDADLTKTHTLWLDPARRTGKKSHRGTERIASPHDFSPSLNWALEAAVRVPATGIKLGPALDHDLIPDGWEAQWVSHGGEVVEVCLYSGAAMQKPGRNALVMGAHSAVQVHEHQLPEADEARIGEVGAYLFEPDGAIIRAGLVTTLTGPLAARRISAPIAYLTGDELPDPSGAIAVRTYRILDSIPASIKHVRKALNERDVGRLVVKKRGSDVVPEQVRKELKLKGTHEATVVFTRVGEDHRALIVEPVAIDASEPPS